MPQKKKKSTKRIDAENILISALVDLIVGLVLLAIDKLT